VAQLVACLHRDLMVPGLNPGKHKKNSNEYSASHYDIIKMNFSFEKVFKI